MSNLPSEPDPLSLSRFIDNENFSDVCFRIEYVKPDGTIKIEDRIRAHRLILAAGSTVFERMFLSPITGTSTEDNEIPIPDVDAKTFRLILKFLYTKHIQKDDLKLDQVLAVWYAAHKYQIEDLEQFCLSMIDTQAEQLFKTDSLFNQQPNSIILEMIISRDTLDVNELTLFKFMVRWAKDQCKRRRLEPNGQNIREMLLPTLLYQIRFSLLPEDDFNKFVKPTNILSEEESSTLSSFINRPRSWQNSDFPLHLYHDKLPNLQSTAIVYSIRFFTNKRIFLTGFDVWGHSPNKNTNGQSTVKIELSIRHHYEYMPFQIEKAMKKFRTSVVRRNKSMFDEHFEIEEIKLNHCKFKEPFEIQAGNAYEIKLSSISPIENTYFNGGRPDPFPMLTGGCRSEQVKLFLIDKKNLFTPLKTIWFSYDCNVDKDKSSINDQQIIN